MAFVCYLLAVILFAVAGLDNGLEATWQDFTAFGLAFFALGHALAGVALPAAVVDRR